MLECGFDSEVLVCGDVTIELDSAYRPEPWKCAHGRTGDCTRLPEREEAQKQSIILPLYHALTGDEQEHVADALEGACAPACGRQ